MQILSWLVFGLVVGAIAKLLYPGNERMGCLSTIALGILGSVMGGVIAKMFGHNDALQPSGWAIGFTIFAAIMLMIAGSFQIIAGLTGIFENEVYAATQDYFLKFDLTPVAALETGANNNTPSGAIPVSYGQIGYGYLAASSDVDYFSFTGTAGDMVWLTVWDNKSMEGATKDIATAIIAPNGSTVLPSLYTNGAGLQVRRTILTSGGTHYVRVSNADNEVYALKLEAHKTAGFEAEPNGTVGTAGALDGGGRASGVIDVAGDLDLYSFTASTGDLVTFSVYAKAAKSSNGWSPFSGYGSTLEPHARILDAAGVGLAESDFSPPGDHSFAESVTNGLATLDVTFVAPADGTYYVEISDSTSSSAACTCLAQNHWATRRTTLPSTRRSGTRCGPRGRTRCCGTTSKMRRWRNCCCR